MHLERFPGSAVHMVEVQSARPIRSLAFPHTLTHTCTRGTHAHSRATLMHTDSQRLASMQGGMNTRMHACTYAHTQANTQVGAYKRTLASAHASLHTLLFPKYSKVDNTFLIIHVMMKLHTNTGKRFFVHTCAYKGIHVQRNL